MKILPYVIALGGMLAGVLGYMEASKIKHEGRFAFARMYAELLMERSELYFKSNPRPNNYGIQFEEKSPNKIRVSVGIPYELHDDFARWMHEYREREIPYSYGLEGVVRQNPMTMNTAFVWDIEILDM
jgi:hypothetical protein